MELSQLKGGSTVLILGAGISGRGAARLANFLGMKPVIVDAKTPSPEPGTEMLCSWTEQRVLPKAELAVISPGISIFSPMAESVRKAGIPIIGELEFAASALPSTCRVCAITGTNGKTTTTELTTLLFQKSGLKAESAGNIGNALSEAALEIIKGKPLDILTVETSSFQLESCTRFLPSSAAILNVASDHINRHGTQENYTAVKFSLLDHLQKPPVLNVNLLETYAKYRKTGLEPVTFSAYDPADFTCEDFILKYHGKPILDQRETSLQGRHNAENMLAALALLKAEAGEGMIFAPEAAAALKSFQPSAHRMEFFCSNNGIRFMDDSKATNPHSVNAALKTYGGARNVVLLLGGLDKDMDFSGIAEDKDKIKSAVLFGECREKIYQTLGNVFPCTMAGMDFREAIQKAIANAEPGDIVALSPACASFDMFKSYADRGDQFQKIVREICGK